MQYDDIKLGQKYRDKITGFEGIATSKHQYLNGCVRISLTPTNLHDNKTIDAEAFDMQQIEYVDSGLLTPVADKAVEARDRHSGGPGDVPKPRYIPKTESI